MRSRGNHKPSTQQRDMPEGYASHSLKVPASALRIGGANLTRSRNPLYNAARSRDPRRDYLDRF